MKQVVIFLVCAISFFICKAQKNNQDTLYFIGYDSVERVDTGWVHLGAEFKPHIKFYQNTDTTAYTYLQIGTNKPILNEGVDVIYKSFLNGVRLIGCVCNSIGAFQIRIIEGTEDAFFVFEPDYIKETMNSMILLKRIKSKQFYKN